MDVLQFGELDKGTCQSILVWNSERKSACVGPVFGKSSMLHKIRIVLWSTVHLEYAPQLRRCQRAQGLIRRYQQGTILKFYNVLL